MDGPSVSKLLQRSFARYARRYVRKHFHKVRIIVRARLDVSAETPVIAYLNHPSWWDPLFGALLAVHLFPDRSHFAPIDAAALERYKFLGRLGFFGVEQNSLRGARTFLRGARQICRRPGAALWLTPQGRFADVRERPVEFEAGLGHLASRLARVVAVPVALEYVWWEERLPEALILVGEPVSFGPGERPPPSELSDLLARKLEAAQDDLASLSLKREAGAFEVLAAGRAGVGGVYDVWRWCRAKLTGRRFSRGHGSLDRGAVEQRSSEA